MNDLLKSLTTKNHKFEFNKYDNEVKITQYYKDANGMWQHMGDLILGLDESIQYVTRIRNLQESMIKAG